MYDRTAVATAAAAVTGGAANAAVAVIVMVLKDEGRRWIWRCRVGRTRRRWASMFAQCRRAAIAAAAAVDAAIAAVVVVVVRRGCAHCDRTIGCPSIIVMRQRRRRYTAGVVALQLLMLDVCDVATTVAAAVMLLMCLLCEVGIAIHSASLSVLKDIKYSYSEHSYKQTFTYLKLPTICLWYSGSSCGGRAMSRWLSVGGDAGLGVLTNSSSSSSSV